jgi:hypothetical protein
MAAGFVRVAVTYYAIAMTVTALAVSWITFTFSALTTYTFSTLLWVAAAAVAACFPGRTTPNTIVTRVTVVTIAARRVAIPAPRHRVNPDKYEDTKSRKSYEGCCAGCLTAQQIYKPVAYRQNTKSISFCCHCSSLLFAIHYFLSAYPLFI